MVTSDLLRLLTDAKIPPPPALPEGVDTEDSCHRPRPWALPSLNFQVLSRMVASALAFPGGGAACVWSKEGRLASSYPLQTACCHELSLAGTNSLSSEDWKEKAGMSCGVMALEPGPPSLLPPAWSAKVLVLFEGRESVSERA